MIRNVEIKTIEHKGVKVTIKVDFDAGTASLVEVQPHSRPFIYQDKHWIFGGRGLEYMNGWLNILEAMTVAVKECKKDLEWKLAQDSAFKDEMIDKVVGLTAELGKQYKNRKLKPIKINKNLLKKAKFHVKVDPKAKRSK